MIMTQYATSESTWDSIKLWQYDDGFDDDDDDDDDCDDYDDNEDALALGL